MPVTAKLSKKFYERFGDDLTTELVDWFNAVDAAYQNQLREINDLNWERFKAELRAQNAELGSELRRESADLGSQLRVEMAELGVQLRAEMAELGVHLRAEMAELGVQLRTEMAELGVQLRREIADRTDALRADFAQMRKENSEFRTNIMKWMFVYWAGSMIPIMVMMFAFLKLLQK